MGRHENGVGSADRFLRWYIDDVLSFGYDPADDADEWWVSWGRLRDAPTASKGKVLADIVDSDAECA